MLLYVPCAFSVLHSNDSEAKDGTRRLAVLPRGRERGREGEGLFDLRLSLMSHIRCLPGLSQDGEQGQEQCSRFVLDTACRTWSQSGVSCCVERKASV